MSSNCPTDLLTHVGNDVYAQLMTKVLTLIAKDWEGYKYAFENNWLHFEASIHCQCSQKHPVHHLLLKAASPLLALTASHL